MRSPKFLFDLMGHMFLGFSLSFCYGCATALIVWALEPQHCRSYIDAFFISFNCLVSGGLIIGTAAFVYLTQRSVSDFIETTFPENDLAATSFYEEKQKY